MNDKLLFLGGGGGAELSKDIDSAFFALLKHNPKILYIPVAWKKVTSSDWFYSLASAYIKIDQSDIYTLLEESEIPDFEDFDAIYIGGGNTFRLLDYLKKNNLIDEIKSFLNHGKPIFGGSAGAIIFGKSLKTVDEERGEYSDDVGFDVCGGYSIRCHYNEKSDAKLLELSNEIPAMILAVPENSGIIFDDKGDIKNVIGTVYLFQNDLKQELKRPE